MTTPSRPDTRTLLQIPDRWLPVYRVLWLASTALCVIIFLSNLPFSFSRNLEALQHFADALAPYNLTPSILAHFNNIQSTIFLLGFVAVGLVLYWRKPKDSLALFVGIMLVTTGFNYASNYDASSPLILLTVIFTALAETTEVIFFYVFPDGRYFPEWMRWTVVPLFLFRALIWANIFLNHVSQGALEVGFVVLLIVIGLVFQVRRYRKASATERQQVKWFLVGLFIAIVVTVPVIYLVDITGLVTYQNNPFLSIILHFVRNLALLAVPVTLGLSMLRYRLWDIDLTINRSIVYALATLILLAVFGAGFFVTQRLLGLLFSDSQSGFSLAVAGILTGALFNPVQQRIRRFVDHRLYGLRFDLNELNHAQQKPEIKNPSALTGTTLGEYEVLDSIGKGGMGEVYKGFHDGQVVAIKTLPDEFSEKEELLERFQREARTLQTLDHPNIVKFYSAATDNKPPYIVIEYIEGQTLSEYLKQHGALPLKEVIALLSPVVDALDYIHQRGIVHRDLKPSNILLKQPTEDIRQPMLMDFGIAKSDEAQSSLTGTGAVGTIDYMAPEQSMSSKDVDLRADIYAMGVIGFEMLTGTRPFTGNPAQVLFGHLQQPAPNPQSLHPEIPASTAHAITRALAKSPKSRYESARLWLEALMPENA